MIPIKDKKKQIPYFNIHHDIRVWYSIYLEMKFIKSKDSMTSFELIPKKKKKLYDDLTNGYIQYSPVKRFIKKIR